MSAPLNKEIPVRKLSTGKHFAFTPQGTVHKVLEYSCSRPGVVSIGTEAGNVCLSPDHMVHTHDPSLVRAEQENKADTPKARRIADGPPSTLRVKKPLSTSVNPGSPD